MSMNSTHTLLKYLPTLVNRAEDLNIIEISSYSDADEQYSQSSLIHSVPPIIPQHIKRMPRSSTIPPYVSPPPSISELPIAPLF